MTFYESINNPSKGKFLSCQLLTILHHLSCMYILVIVNIWHKNQDELVIFDRKPRRVRCRFLKYSFKVLKNTQEINVNLLHFFSFIFFFRVVFFFLNRDVQIVYTLHSSRLEDLSSIYFFPFFVFYDFFVFFHFFQCF